MNNFIFKNNPEISLNVEEQFVYNYYDEEETLTDDSLFYNNQNNSLKYIEININSRNIYDYRLFYLKNTINLELINNLEQSNIDNNDFYFNKQKKISGNNICLYLDKKEEEIQNINDYYNLQTASHREAIDFLSSNKKITISKNPETLDSFLQSNLENNVFFTDNVEESMQSYYLVNSKQYDKDANISELVLNKGFTVFNKTSSYSANNYLSVKPYYVNIGFLIEKYRYSDNILDYEKVSSYFTKGNFQIDNDLQLNSSYFLENNFTIKDAGVKYGKSYRYAIYPVYYITMPSKDNYHVVDHFLICDHPYVTSEIECIETKRPAEPPMMMFNYNKKDEMTIKWSTPIEEQGDVRGYQIFKRYSLKDPFVLIAQIEFHSINDSYERNFNVSQSIVYKRNKMSQNIYIDKSFRKDKVQVYAICSIDARGMTSNYSSQYGVKYVDNKCDVDLVSLSGAPLHMPNLLLPRRSKYFENDDYIVNNTSVESNVKKFTLYATPEFHSINTRGSGTGEFVLSDEYKFSIIKLENSSTHIENIFITNFN